MRLSDLSPDGIAAIKAYHLDRLVEKHEGWPWELGLRSAERELLDVDGYHVLLPVTEEQYPNIAVARCIPSKDDSLLTIFLRDTTIPDSIWQGEFLAVCARVPDTHVYVAFAYHECGFTDWTIRGEAPPLRPSG